MPRVPYNATIATIEFLKIFERSRAILRTVGKVFVRRPFWGQRRSRGRLSDADGNLLTRFLLIAGDAAVVFVTVRRC